MSENKDNHYVVAQSSQITDYGPNPVVFNIDAVTEANENFRTTLWTGGFLQLTLMSLKQGEEIGLEMHPDVDQFIRIEEGKAMVMMGETKDNLYFRQQAGDEDAVIVPAGKWHNMKNIGDEPLKLYSVYAPPNHPFNTVHETKEIAEQDEK